MLEFKDSITADEINYLRAAIGFRQILPEQIEAGLKGSALIISAYDSGNLIGTGRLIWDGGVVTLIHDLIVIPQYRSLGIEAKIINLILDYLKTQLKPGFGIQVDIRAWGEQQTICTDVGFILSTSERRGVPMHICLTKQIELTDKLYKQMKYVEE